MLRYEYDSGYEQILHDQQIENLVAEEHELTIFILNNEYRKLEIALDNFLFLINEEVRRE